MVAAVFNLANGITAQAFNTIIQLKCAVFGKDTNKNKMKSHFLKQGVLTITLMLISALTIFTFSSCNKEEMDNNTAPNDNYYVNYIIRGPGPYGRFSDWTATTPDGAYSNSGYQTRSWNQTYGPVKRGFKCEVQIGYYQGGTPTIEIHVSKNEEPFALKATTTGASASYVIDF